MATAVISAITRRKVRKDVAMTGEITLRGKVLPVGGIKEKIIAAHGAHVRTIVLPKDNENYLLKPLYSFAGVGIKFSPTQADLDAIPRDQRPNYILQERIRFEPVIQTPHGPTQMEIRMMFVWPESGELMPVLPLVRMGRGMMMGVDHNRNLEWVGGSSALWV